MNGLVLTSGGTKCAFQVGVLQALDELGVDFDMGAAASGGVPNLFYYLAGRVGMMENIWTTRIASKKFIDLTRYLTDKPIMDVRYLVYDVFRNQSSFHDTQHIRLDAEIVFPLYNMTQERVEYHEFNSGTHQDALDLIFAAVTAPFISDDPILFGGDHFCDGAFIDPCPWERVQEKGTRNVVVVGTRPLLTRDYPAWFVKMLFRKHKNGSVEKTRQKVLESLTILDEKMLALKRANRDDVIMITPKHGNRFTNHLLSNSKKHITHVIRQGYETVMGNPELKERLQYISQR